MGFFGGSQPKRPASRRPAPRPTPSPSFDAESDKAMAQLQLRTSAHVGAWHMDECAWTVDQGTGQITFTDTKRGIVATAPVQIIGTYNTEDSTWLWAWANSSMEAALVTDAQKLKAYGAEKGYAKLTAAKMKCDEMTAWKLAAMACMVCGQQGAYRGPAGTTMVFMTFGTVAMKKLGKG